MSTPDLISIVISVYNRSDALIAVLDGLAAQDDLGFEIVIADDGSTQQHQDAVKNAASALGLSICHVWHPDVGFTLARVRNLGVSASRGDYLIFLDGDSVPERDFVRRHRQLRAPACFVNGSRVLLSETLTKTVLAGRARLVGKPAAFWFGRWWARDANKLTGLLRLPDGRYRKKPGFKWRGIRGCNMAVWRADFEAVNGFDESFVGWGHEDADFVLRLHNHGVVRKNGFCATEVYHLWHPVSSRTEAPANAERVRQREQTLQVKADLGYLECRSHGQVLVSKWP